MAQSKKTPEELELAAHNRLKGTICFHTSSAISQLEVLNIMINRYLQGCEDIEERKRVNKILLSLYPIISAAKRMRSYIYVQLDITRPKYLYTRNSRKPKPYGT